MQSRIAVAVALLGFSAVIATAQPFSADPDAGPPGPGRIEPAAPAPLERVPLTAAEREEIDRRFAAYRAYLLTETPRAADLMRFGLTETADAVEWASGIGDVEIGPIHIGVLTPLAASPVADVDPALAARVRGTLFARLGREPSPVELAVEIEKSDARIARINEALAAGRAEIARSMRSDGTFTRALERRILRLPDAAEPSDPEGVAEGLQTLIRSLLLGKIDTQLPDAPRVSPASSVPDHAGPAQPERGLDPR